jgi:hypothetical protein
MVTGENGYRNLGVFQLDSGFAVAGAFLNSIQGLCVLTAGSGNCFGANTVATALLGVAATAEINSLEANTDVRTAVTRKTGVQIVDVATSTGAGSAFDAGLLMTAQVGGAGYLYGIDFNSTATTFPVKAAGTVIRAQAGTVTNGIDFSALTTSASFLKGPGNTFTVSGTGYTVLNQNTAAAPAAPAGATLEVSAFDSAQAGINLDAYSNYSQIIFRRSDGTNASKSAIQANDQIGTVAWYGYGSTGYSSDLRASLSTSAAQTWTDTAQGTVTAINTTLNGTTTPAAALSLGNDKTVSIFGSLRNSTTVINAVTAPTISSGFCTSPSIPNNNGTWAFTVNVGSSCGVSTGTIAMPTAATGWVCDAHDVTTPASNSVQQTGGTASTVVLQNYVRTTGVAGNFTSSDVIRVKCAAY